MHTVASCLERWGLTFSWFSIKMAIKYLCHEIIKLFVFQHQRKKHIKLIMKFVSILCVLSLPFRVAFSCSKKSAGMFFHTSKVQSLKLVKFFPASHNPNNPNTFSDVEVWTLGWAVHYSENTSSFFELQKFFFFVFFLFSVRAFWQLHILSDS